MAAPVTLLRICTAGSVDDGKSTLIGRLLHDTGNIYDDHLVSLEKSSAKVAADQEIVTVGEGKRKLALALVTDGLTAEQEQGITIDVAYRYFSTPHRRVILADTPGHEQYTRNMATGASTADLAIILADARAGILSQTRRHAFIASLLGVPRILLAVNKMDLVNYEQEVFERIAADFSDFAAQLGVTELRTVPISALRGDNVVARSQPMAWYRGETVLEYLDQVYVAGDQNRVDFRFPIQSVIRGADGYRGYAGVVASGSIRVGEEVLVLPSLRRTVIIEIESPGPGVTGQSRKRAEVGESVSLLLADEIDIGRGNMIVRPGNVPRMEDKADAMLVWLGDAPADTSRAYTVMHTTREVKAYIADIRYRVDVDTLHRSNASSFKVNEIGRVSLNLSAPLFIDSYQTNRATGNFILIDPQSCLTVAAGMFLDRRSADAAGLKAPGDPKRESTSKNLHPETGLVSTKERQSRVGHRPQTLWFTGLSGSGKSTIAAQLERRLFDAGQFVFRLDGDLVRTGLCRDLGFSADDRTENLRRVAEVARLMNEAGLTVLCSFISPLASDRAMAQAIIGEDRFTEIYVSTPLEICEKRDPHGLYAKARRGEIKGFTGIDAPYEAPANAALTIDAGKNPVESCVQEILARV